MYATKRKSVIRPNPGIFRIKIASFKKLIVNIDVNKDSFVIFISKKQIPLSLLNK